MDNIANQPNLYDLFNINCVEDIPMYLEITNNYETVFEFGIGTGRILLPLVKAGKKIYGIDNSIAMLKFFDEKKNKLQDEEKSRIVVNNDDMRYFRSTRKAPCIIIGFCTFNYLLDIKDQKDCLISVRDTLEQGGFAIS